MGNRRYGVPKEMQWNTTTSARGHFPFFVAPDPSLVHGDQTLEQQSKKQRSARFFGKAIDASARPCCVCQKKSNACLLAKQQQRRRTLCRQNATKRNQMQSQTTTAQKDALGVVHFPFWAVPVRLPVVAFRAQQRQQRQQPLLFEEARLF